MNDVVLSMLSGLTLSTIGLAIGILIGKELWFTKGYLKALKDMKIEKGG